MWYGRTHAQVRTMGSHAAMNPAQIDAIGTIRFDIYKATLLKRTSTYLVSHMPVVSVPRTVNLRVS